MSDKKTTHDEKLGMREEHPSWVAVHFSRVSGQRNNFFGSAIQCQSWIELRVSRARRYHDLGRDTVHGGHRGEIIEIAFTPAQFAELLTTMNVGSGVPGTLQVLNGERVAQLEEEETEHHRIEKAFRERMDEKNGNLAKRLEYLNEEIQKLKISKAKKEDLEKSLSGILTEVGSNIPFYVKQYEKAMIKTKVEAKAEIEAMVTHVVQQTGLEALRNKVHVPQLAEGPNEANSQGTDKSPVK